MKPAVVTALKKSQMSFPTKLNKPEMAIFWAEPLLGPVSYMSLPEYYGEEAYQMRVSEQAAFKKFNEPNLRLTRKNFPTSPMKAGKFPTRSMKIMKPHTPNS